MDGNRRHPPPMGDFRAGATHGLYSTAAPLTTRAPAVDVSPIPRYPPGRELPSTQWAQRMSEALSETEIVTRLRTQFVGRAVEVHAEIGSTNTRAGELARMGAPDGALVLAERQTAGRGRLGRAWHAPAGSSLLMSLVLRPRLAPTQAQRMTMIASVALVSAIRATTSLEARVKWPNDVQI
ncbi:MAG: biotin--[acetyl-CoA-carboxylase] ligase, partial [Chloroflexi bacterium]|nr:biotin--[acetyl-CoA-carboxylase] ligase [Chloroflexota bacterium]